MGKFENGGNSAEGRKILPMHLQSLICVYQEEPLGVAAEHISVQLWIVGMRSRGFSSITGMKKSSVWISLQATFVRKRNKCYSARSQIPNHWGSGGEMHDDLGSKISCALMYLSFF